MCCFFASLAVSQAEPNKITSSSDDTFDEFDIDLDLLTLERNASFSSLNSSSSNFLFLFSSSLTASKEEQFFESLKDLILRVNQHAVLRDYAIVLLRIKKNKKSETRKI
jgi:hypothetical protein